LWVSDVGEYSWESICRVQRGGNYGWSRWEGGHEFWPHGKLGPGRLMQPAASHQHSQCSAIVGGFVYHGHRFPELAEHYLYADFSFGDIYALSIAHEEQGPKTIAKSIQAKIVALAEGDDGQIYLFSVDGGMHRLDVAEKGKSSLPPFPRKLSETGLFASVRDHQMQPGCIPYSVNSQLWSDGATKRRFIAVPEQGVIVSNPGFRFPDNTVLVKTFSFPIEQHDNRNEQFIETRLLHVQQGQWRGYSYRWNDQQDDAELVDEAGASQALELHDRSGKLLKQVWRFPSRNECFGCHTGNAGFVLGFTTPQLNRDHDYGAVRDNQLRTLSHLGLVKGIWTRRHAYGYLPLDPARALPRLAAATDDHEPLEARARAYLQTNCAHCHLYFGSVGEAAAPFYRKLSGHLPAHMTRLDIAPSKGDLGIKDARIIAPGAPERSMIYSRMTTVGHGRMPNIGSAVVDEDGSKLVADWIRSLAPSYFEDR
ncbi:MAG TPA: PQQ-dependent sugar dehydrogenase, partial [Pirellulales bacterium]|nr:PQQ-dependent sugar dehydrogenase [Pirellulales bacterium]